MGWSEFFGGLTFGRLAQAFPGVKILSLISLGLLVAGATAAESLPAEDRAWRDERVARLTKPDGWLTLVGLHFLKDGANSVGSAAGNDVVLAQGPARLGTVTVTVAAGGKVSLKVAAGVETRVEDRVVREVELKWDAPSAPTKVTVGSVTLFAIDRGGKKALRVKDSAAPRRVQFSGLKYFPIDPAWRVAARWMPFEKARLMPVKNILGQVSSESVAGKAVFERDGKTFELLAIDEGPDDPLFFVISDATSGRETYGGGRHLYAPRPTGNTLILDFNRAENPPCAFTPFSTCPVPPKENQLPFAVAAGEKAYRGGPE